MTAATFEQKAKQLVESNRESVEHLVQHGNALERAMAKTFLDASEVRG